MKTPKIHFGGYLTDNCGESDFYVECWINNFKNQLPDITNEWSKVTCKACIKSRGSGLSDLAKYADEHEII